MALNEMLNCKEGFTCLYVVDHISGDEKDWSSSFWPRPFKACRYDLCFPANPSLFLVRNDRKSDKK